MFKNVASQKIAVFAFDTTTGAAKTGDSANITVYVSKDYGAVTALTDTTATEMDATNAKGWYLFDVSQSETNADALLFTGKSSTSNISIVGQLIYTVPANFSTLSVDSNGRVDVIKVAGTTQTARDLGASVLLSPGTGTGQISLSSGAVTTGTLSASAIQAIWDAATSALTTVGSIGKLIVDNLNATISSVKSQTDLIPGTQDGYTFAQFVKLAGAALLGKASGLATTTATFRSMNDGADRIVATVDSNGNRTAVTLTP